MKGLDENMWVIPNAGEALQPFNAKPVQTAGVKVTFIDRNIQMQGF